MTTLYIAGPMRGKRHFNFPAFFDAAERLKSVGYDVVSPAERDVSNGFDPISRDLTGDEDLAAEGFDLREALAWDLTQIAERCDGIALLPGWMSSRGARAEQALGEALGIQTWPTERWIKLAVHEVPA